MLSRGSIESCPNQYRSIFLGGKKSILAGRKSYVVGYQMEFFSLPVHISIGNYCSIAHEILFCLGINHDYRLVTTYPLGLLGAASVHDGTAAETSEKSYNVSHSQILIGNDVWIGRGATIFGGVKIGNGAVIGTNAMVTKDVPPYAIAVGNPARVVKYRFDAALIRKLNAIKWWYWPEKKIIEHRALLEDPAAFADAFYTPALEERQSSPLALQLQEIRAAEIQIFYFAADWGEKDALWERVICQYLRTYCAKDRVLLVIEGTGTEMHEEERKKIYALICACGQEAPAIMECKSENRLPLDILQNIDVLIAGQDACTMVCCDYAADYGAEIRFALDDVIFVRTEKET